MPARSPVRLPVLVVVSGVPGSGKTTLARMLSDELHLPMVCRDEIKEGMHATRRDVSPQAIEEISVAGWDAFYAVVDRHLTEGVSVIAEAAFHAGRSDEINALAPNLAVAVDCVVDVGMARDRFKARADRGERHAAHRDHHGVARMDRGEFPFALYGAPLRDAPTLTVDTTNGYDPPFGDIAAFVRRSATLA